MSKDRFGNPIFIGWPSAHILWIEAALTLPKHERAAAFEDIAAVTGRTVSAVRSKAYWMVERRRMEMLRRSRETRFSMVPARSAPCPQRAASSLRQPTKQQLMGAR